MKQERLPQAASIWLTAVTVLAVLGSCASSIPPMTLSHFDALTERHREIGTLSVGAFLDERPLEEQTPGAKIGTAVLLAPYIWSGSTQPPMADFVRDTIRQEAERTGIFRSADPGEFELTGTLLSLRATRQKTILSYTLILAERPIYEAVVEIAVELSRRGTPISTQTVRAVETERISGWQETSRARMSALAGELLDRALTRAVGELFQKISADVAAAPQPATPAGVLRTATQPIGGRPVLTVLDLRPSGVAEGDAALLTDYIGSSVAQAGVYRVIDRTQRQAILDELEFSNADCTDEGCQLQIGRLLSAAKILTGSIGKVGGKFVLNLNLIDVETGETESTASELYTTIDLVLEDTRRMTRTLVGAATPQSAAAAETRAGGAASAASTAPSSVARAAAPRGRSLFVDLGVGFVFGEEGRGPEADVSLRWMFVPKIGAAVGILGGYDLGPDSGMKIGMILSGYYQVSDTIAIGLGFKGFPEYINSLGGVTLTVLVNRFLVRGAIDVLGFNGAAVDVGYSL